MFIKRREISESSLNSVALTINIDLNNYLLQGQIQTTVLKRKHNGAIQHPSMYVALDCEFVGVGKKDTGALGGFDLPF